MNGTAQEEYAKKLAGEYAEKIAALDLNPVIPKTFNVPKLFLSLVAVLCSLSVPTLLFTKAQTDDKKTKDLQNIFIVIATTLGIISLLCLAFWFPNVDKFTIWSQQNYASSVLGLAGLFYMLIFISYKILNYSTHLEINKVVSKMKDEIKDTSEALLDANPSASAAEVKTAVDTAVDNKNYNLEGFKKSVYGGDHVDFLMSSGMVLFTGIIMYFNSSDSQVAQDNIDRLTREAFFIKTAEVSLRKDLDGLRDEYKQELKEKKERKSQELREEIGTADTSAALKSFDSQTEDYKKLRRLLRKARKHASERNKKLRVIMAQQDNASKYIQLGDHIRAHTSIGRPDQQLSDATIDHFRTFKQNPEVDFETQVRGFVSDHYASVEELKNDIDIISIMKEYIKLVIKSSVNVVQILLDGLENYIVRGIYEERVDVAQVNQFILTIAQFIQENYTGDLEGSEVKYIKQKIEIVNSRGSDKLGLDLKPLEEAFNRTEIPELEMYEVIERKITVPGIAEMILEKEIQARVQAIKAKTKEQYLEDSLTILGIGVTEDLKRNLLSQYDSKFLQLGDTDIYNIVLAAYPTGATTNWVTEMIFNEEAVWPSYADVSENISRRLESTMNGNIYPFLKNSWTYGENLVINERNQHKILMQYVESLMTSPDGSAIIESDPAVVTKNTTIITGIMEHYMEPEIASDGTVLTPLRPGFGSATSSKASVTTIASKFYKYLEKNNVDYETLDLSVSVKDQMDSVSREIDSSQLAAVVDSVTGSSEVMSDYQRALADYKDKEVQRRMAAMKKYADVVVSEKQTEFDEEQRGLGEEEINPMRAELDAAKDISANIKNVVKTDVLTNPTKNSGIDDFWIKNKVRDEGARVVYNRILDEVKEKAGTGDLKNLGSLGEGDKVPLGKLIDDSKFVQTKLKNILETPKGDSSRATQDIINQLTSVAAEPSGTKLLEPVRDAVYNTLRVQKDAVDKLKVSDIKLSTIGEQGENPGIFPSLDMQKIRGRVIESSGNPIRT